VEGPAEDAGIEVADAGHVFGTAGESNGGSQKQEGQSGEHVPGNGKRGNAELVADVSRDGHGRSSNEEVPGKSAASERRLTLEIS